MNPTGKKIEKPRGILGTDCPYGNYDCPTCCTPDSPKSSESWGKYKDLTPCTDMVIYRKLEKVFSDLCRKEIGITTAIDYVAHLLDQAYSNGKRDGRSTASFLSEIKRVKSEVRNELVKLIESKRLSDKDASDPIWQEGYSRALDDLLTDLKENR